MPEYGSGGGYTVVMAGPFASSGGGAGKLTTISAPVANWKGGTSPYSQVVAMDDISINSKIDIQLSADQIELFSGQDIAFTVENRSGEVTLVAVGDKPSADCVFQATASDVLIVGNIDSTVILGNTVKTTSFPKTGGEMSKPINMNGQNLYGLNDPNEDDEAVNKGYVDTNKVDKTKVVNGFDTTKEGFVADARALKVLNDAKISMKLLWKNGSPTSGFGANTIDLIDNNAKLFLGRFRSFGSNRVSDDIFKPGESVILNDINCLETMFASPLMTLMREITVCTQTSITFSQGYYNVANGSASEWHEGSGLLVPVEIYGIEEISE